jgi:hypothetical protein
LAFMDHAMMFPTKKNSPQTFWNNQSDGRPSWAHHRWRMAYASDGRLE